MKGKTLLLKSSSKSSRINPALLRFCVSRDFKQNVANVALDKAFVK